MANIMSAPSKALLEAFSPIRRQGICSCTRASQTQSRQQLRQRRNVSTASVQRSEMDVNKEDRPRWAHTPPAMKAPYPIKSRPADWQPFRSNSNPQVLDQFYAKFLGAEGPKLLSEETKWLAVTHKSFDHGRRGFNDRLAFLGKRILELQTSLGLLSSIDASRRLPNNGIDPHGRQPFVHPATSNVEALLGDQKSFFMHHTQISNLAEQYSISTVVRWQPKDPENLLGSGCNMVYAQAIFAIIGALAMEQGGAMANQIARERVIQQLGITEPKKGISEQAQIS